MFDETWKDKIIEGSTFPGKPYSDKIVVKITKELQNEYLPALKKKCLKKGFELLLTAMTNKEGFYKGTRSYVNNNPGNIGNTTDGKNNRLPSLDAGIDLQINFVNNLIANKNKNYQLGKVKLIPAVYDKEIARNSKTYGMSPWLPGYKFTFTGQLDQFVKIYSTGARGGNSYINMIVSYFKQNGITITPESKIQDIIAIND